MDSTDEMRFVSALTACAEYYGKDLSPAIMGLYWQGLERFSLAAVEHALKLHMAHPDSGQFMPKIADIVRLSEGSGEDASMQAWTKVDKGMRSIGPYQDVVFDDAVIHRVLSEMGGWVELSRKTEHEWPFIAKEFQTRYRGYRGRGGVTEYPRVLAGITNSTNAQVGHKPQPPVLIGDERKARAVLQGGSLAPALPMKPMGNLLSSVVASMESSEQAA